MPTLAAIAERWLAPAVVDADEGADGRLARRPQRKTVSPHWRRTQLCLAKHLLAAIGDIDVEDLGPADIWTVQEYALDRGLSPETVNKITHNLLSAMLTQAEKAGVVPDGTRDRILKRADKLDAGGNQNGQALTVEERDRLIREARKHWSGNLVAFLLYTGLRIGEAAALRQRHVDWARGDIRVQHSRRGQEVSTGKNSSSRRTLHLAQAALAAIRPLRNDSEPDGLLFKGPLGGPICADNYRSRDWYEIVEAAGLRRIRIHDTRHTFVTLVLEGGLSLAAVAAYVGASQRTIERRYAHVIPTRDLDRVMHAPLLRWSAPDHSAGAELEESA